MRIWIDTEFNDFRGRLISMGLVAEDGNECYFQMYCPEDEMTGWVYKHVLPHLKDETTVSFSQAQSMLEKFLKGYDSVCIIADYPADIQHFMYMLELGGGMTMRIPKELSCTIIYGLPGTAERSKIPHHALHDAHALMELHLESEL